MLTAIQHNGSIMGFTAHIYLISCSVKVHRPLLKSRNRCFWHTQLEFWTDKNDNLILLKL